MRRHKLIDPDTEKNKFKVSIEVPCKECIAYAACRTKQEISCAKAFQYVYDWKNRINEYLPNTTVIRDVPPRPTVFSPIAYKTRDGQGDNCKLKWTILKLVQ